MWCSKVVACFLLCETYMIILCWACGPEGEQKIKRREWVLPCLNCKATATRSKTEEVSINGFARCHVRFGSASACRALYLKVRVYSIEIQIKTDENPTSPKSRLCQFMKSDDFIICPKLSQTYPENCFVPSCWTRSVCSQRVDIYIILDSPVRINCKITCPKPFMKGNGCHL